MQSCSQQIRSLARILTRMHTFVDALEEVKEIYRMAHATTVEIDHREKIELFRNTWLTLMQDFGQTMPSKVHIILDHLSDYF